MRLQECCRCHPLTHLHLYPPHSHQPRSCSPNLVPFSRSSSLSCSRSLNLWLRLGLRLSHCSSSRFAVAVLPGRDWTENTAHFEYIQREIQIHIQIEIQIEIQGEERDSWNELFIIKNQVNHGSTQIEVRVEVQVCLLLCLPYSSSSNPV